LAIFHWKAVLRRFVLFDGISVIIKYSNQIRSWRCSDDFRKSMIMTNGKYPEITAVLMTKGAFESGPVVRLSEI
jgi:hypothetical protein